MAKKIEVDIAYLKSVGLSQKQISDIIKNSEPEHWTNKLPFGNEYYSLKHSLIASPQEKESQIIVGLRDSGVEYDATVSFFDKKDAEFIENKCRLLVEMSNYSFFLFIHQELCHSDPDPRGPRLPAQQGARRL